MPKTGVGLNVFKKNEPDRSSGSLSDIKFALQDIFATGLIYFVFADKESITILICTVQSNH